MNSLDHAVGEIARLDELASRDSPISRRHALAKLAVTIAFIVTVVSFPRTNVAGLVACAAYPAAIFTLGGLSFRESLGRLRLVLPLVCLVGALEPVFDRSAAGAVSALTLAGKGALTVLASYLLVATATIDGICAALASLRVPSPIVCEIMLIHRYITLLLREASRVSTAYSLRAPGQNGVHWRAWGSLAGLLLLRSVDRAETVWQAMSLRGFIGGFSRGLETFRAADAAYALGWCAAFALIRYAFQ